VEAVYRQPALDKPAPPSRASSLRLWSRLGAAHGPRVAQRARCCPPHTSLRDERTDLTIVDHRSPRHCARPFLQPLFERVSSTAGWGRVARGCRAGWKRLRSARHGLHPQPRATAVGLSTLSGYCWPNTDVSNRTVLRWGQSLGFKCRLRLASTADRSAVGDGSCPAE